MSLSTGINSYTDKDTPHVCKTNFSEVVRLTPPSGRTVKYADYGKEAVVVDGDNPPEALLPLKPKSRKKGGKSSSSAVPTQPDSKPLVSPRPLIALTMMVKNETKRIEVSLESVREVADRIIIMDTGSTDDTKTKIISFCKLHSLPLFMIEEPFVDFSTSRNVLLDYADTLPSSENQYLLMLDCNDELRQPGRLRYFIDHYSGPATGFYLTQEWWNGATLDKYLNVRLVKGFNPSHEKGARWRYKGVVHEYITFPGVNTDAMVRIEGVVLYQDRTKDDDKSMKRFKRDKILLYNEHIKYPNEPRTLFYLAQTCGCLNDMQEAFKYYRLRTLEAGFHEERFHSFIRMGELSQKLKYDWEESIVLFLKAYECIPRAEPLIKIAEYYKDKNWSMAYMYSKQACQLVYPVNCVLFVNRRDYDYYRYHLHGLVCYYFEGYGGTTKEEIDKEGIEASMKAVRAEKLELDKDNLKKYQEKIKGGTVKLTQENRERKTLEYLMFSTSGR